MKAQPLKTLDACIRESLLPVLESQGFSGVNLRRFERKGATPGTADVIEVQLGKLITQGYFCINAVIERKEEDRVDRSKRIRLGQWPFSLLRLPQIIGFAPVVFLLFPCCWAVLFADCWWRYSRFKNYTGLAIWDARWLFTRQALPWFAASHKNEKLA